MSLIPGLGRSPGGGHDNPLQYSCLENPHGQRNLAGYSSWGLKELDLFYSYPYTYLICFFVYVESEKVVQMKLFAGQE